MMMTISTILVFLSRMRKMQLNSRFNRHQPKSGKLRSRAGRFASFDAGPPKKIAGRGGAILNGEWYFKAVSNAEFISASQANGAEVCDAGTGVFFGHRSVTFVQTPGFLQFVPAAY